jgi:hypothetical protein
MNYKDTLTDKLYARGVIRYFLANANTFRGDKAKALKNELKVLL